MNIFILDKDPMKAAMMLCDRHVPKMIVESAQMLSTAHRVLDGDTNADAKLLYKKAYENHPSCVWVRQDAMNYWWVWMHALTLCEEYKWRFVDDQPSTKTHKTEFVIHQLQDLPVNIPTEKDTNWEILKDLPLCMPDQYKTENGYDQRTTQAYQSFVTRDKPYMEDVFKAYTRAIQKKQAYQDHHSNSSGVAYPPEWVTNYATAEQKKHIDLHKLMNPETAI